MGEVRWLDGEEPALPPGCPHFQTGLLRKERCGDDRRGAFVVATDATRSVTVRDLEITDSRETRVGAVGVRQALPRRGRRAVGAWCFVDHMGPARASPPRGIGVAPHPHVGLQTVTWLVEGEALHRDSLGTEQVVRSGQLDLMTGGRGVSHSEEGIGNYRGTLHGVQLWIAQPSALRPCPTRPRGLTCSRHPTVVGVLRDSRAR